MYKVIPLTYLYRYVDYEAIMHPELKPSLCVNRSANILHGNRLRSFWVDFEFAKIFFIIYIVDKIVTFATGMSMFVSIIDNSGLNGKILFLIGWIIFEFLVSTYFYMKLMMSHVIFYEDLKYEKLNSDEMTII